jgi:hypothetical protein
MISMPEAAFEELIEAAAARGARKALAEVGLADEHAAGDIHDLRGILKAISAVKRGALQRLGSMLMYLAVGAFLMFLGVKLKLFGLAGVGPTP